MSAERQGKKTGQRKKTGYAEHERRRIVRWAELLEILPYGETMIRNELISTGRLRPVPLGPRATGFVTAEVYEILDELIARRDAASAEETTTG